MSARTAIMERIRSATQSRHDPESVRNRLEKHPAGVIPARGRLDPADRLDLFAKMARSVEASVEKVAQSRDVPKAVSSYLRSKNLPAELRMGADSRLARMPWKSTRNLKIKKGASDGYDEVCLSHAQAGIAETGTLALVSGPGNPTTLNLLPEHHIVIVKASDIVGDMESVFTKLRKNFGSGKMSRSLHFITGPSRSADVEQTIVVGAHGPRALHIIIVE